MPISKEHKVVLFLAFVVVFLDTINYALIVPILPFLVKEMGSTPLQEGILFSGYSVMQLISLLIVGALSDVYGRKVFLLLSLVGSCFGSIFQGMSYTMWPLIFWRAITGLFAGSQILVQAVIADLTDPSERNGWLARLDATISASFIIGPAVGGLLGQVNYHFPLYVAGIVSGLALIFAFFFLKETNQTIAEIHILKKSVRHETKEKKMEVYQEIKRKRSSIQKEVNNAKPKLTKIMFFCFIFEFCVRWAVNAFDARYGIFLNDKFVISSGLYTTVVCLQSISTCLIQAFVYPYVTTKLNVPIPYMAVTGISIMAISYIIMAAPNNLWWSLIGSEILWIGFCFASPTSSSIISTTNNPAVQGKVLSWNNFVGQSSLISTPLVLSAIYIASPEGMYYFSSGLTCIAVVVMAYVCTWKNVKLLGKDSLNKESTQNDITPSESEKLEMKDVEMITIVEDSSPEKSIPIVENPSSVEVSIYPVDLAPSQPTKYAQSAENVGVASI